MGHAIMKCQMLLETIFKKLCNNLFFTLTNTLLDRVKEGVFIVGSIIYRVDGENPPTLF